MKLPIKKGKKDGGAGRLDGTYLTVTSVSVPI